jgi:hypothetical protein
LLQNFELHVNAPHFRGALGVKAAALVALKRRDRLGLVISSQSFVQK